MTISIVCLVYNGLVFAGLVYLVGWHGWSPFTLLWYFVLGASFSSKK